MFFPKSN